MPPGMDVVKIGNSSLRTNGTTVTMRTRHSTSLLVSVSPKTAMLKRRRTDLKPPTPTLQKRRSAPVRNGEEENQEVLDRVLPRNGVNPSKPSKTSKLSRKGVHPAAEIYSKKLYRQVATGFDMDEGSDTELPETSSRAVITDNWRPEYSWGTQELAHPDAIPQMEIDDDGFILDEKPAFILPTKLIACDVTTPYATDPEIFMTPPVSPQAYNYEFTAHDEVFLVRLNEQRKLASGKEYLDIKTFCTVIKCLEELTFLKIHDYLLDNLHAVYTRPPERGSEDEASVPCDVCGIAECDKDDEMVFCDMCHTCVHMCCAGILTLPPEYEQWKCLKCENTNTPSPKCHLCPCLGGSMTSNADKSLWAHHVCALFHPEVIFEDWERRWPMKELDKILPERWTDVCSVCDTRMGACIGCVEPGCDETFHVCCALRAGLTVRIQEVPNDPEQNIFRLTKCARHTQPHELALDEKYRECSKPWLTKLESVFYVMTDYEKVAEKLNLEEIVVSDIYEYWKQKRSEQNCTPLIPNLHEFLKIEPSIIRVAEKAAAHLAAEMGESSACSSTPNLPPHFFPRAALMVTELRQHHLKRVRHAIEIDRQMLTMIERREILKMKSIKAEQQALRLAADMLRMAKPSVSCVMLEEMWQIPKDQIKQAQSPENFEQYVKELEARMKPKSVLRSPQKKHFYWPLQKEQQQKLASSKSPLRPRNAYIQTNSSAKRKHEEEDGEMIGQSSAKRRPGRARIYPVGYKHPTTYARRGRPTKEQQLQVMLNNSNTSLPSPTVAAQSSSSEPSTLVRQRCHLVETVEALRTRKSFPPYCRYSRFSAINDSFDYYPP